MRVLVADDDPVSMLFLEDALQDSGYEVVSVADGKSAYETLNQPGGPMLAILDWMMPVMDGVTVCRELRGSVRDRYIYLMVLTSKQDTEFVVEAIDAGADDFISKPYDLSELQARLRAGRRISELEQELRIKATRDALTGLYNRGAIIDILAKSLARQSRNAHPVSVIFADLDHFKQTNDNYGHQVGDEVLREVARRGTRVLRSYDSFGRYGGEEMLIVLPECNAACALKVAERVRAEIANQPITTDSGPITITLSLGVAAAEREAATHLDRLISSTDSALYKAKGNGRNCAVLADSTGYGEENGKR